MKIGKLIGVRQVMVGVCAAAALSVSGCSTMYNTNEARSSELRREGSMVFVRPNRYSILGTKSLRDYCEVVYEKFTLNEAGMPTVKFGLRNRGGKHWWDTRGPRIVIAAKAVFYEDPLSSGAITSPPVYETNWQRLPMTRGETIHYSFVCPVDAGGYQVTMSDAFQ